jgi:hypothetical protein
MLTIRTETWNTAQGKAIKAVVRTNDGKFVGATNQTKAVPFSKIIKGK